MHVRVQKTLTDLVQGVVRRPHAANLRLAIQNALGNALTYPGDVAELSCAAANDDTIASTAADARAATEEEYEPPSDADEPSSLLGRAVAEAARKETAER